MHITFLKGSDFTESVDKACFLMDSEYLPFVRILFGVCLLFLFESSSFSYSVLTHEAIIDSVWKDSLKPLLLQRYPDSTPDELLKARSFAYGGSMVQDMGYYPFGSKMFSDLIHYVRSGEFIEILIRESRNLNEYAFALGTLSHYPSDCNGHELATNRAVPILFPELQKKYGNIITYDEKPSAHIRVEFGYDVLQVARGNYLPDSYHDFIGFELSEELLERAFPKAYGLELKAVLKNFDLAKGTFRYSIRDLIPKLTDVAWELKKDEILKLNSGITKEKFRYLMPRKDFEKEFGREYRKPGLCTRLLSLFIRIIPKIGPFKTLAVKVPTPEVAQTFLESYAVTVTRYQALLSQVKNTTLHLENRNLDTGQPTKFGEYELADKTYAKLVKDLAAKNFAGLTPKLKEDILKFFSNLETVDIARKDSDDWVETLKHLQALESIQISTGISEQQSEFYFKNSSCFRLQ